MLSPCELVCSTRTCADAAVDSVRMATAAMAARISTFPAHRVIGAPDAGAAGGDVEKREAEEHRVNAAIRLRNQQSERQPRPHRRRAKLHHVHVEVGDRHLAAGHEGRDPREEPDHDQQSADRLDGAGRPLQRHQLRLLAAEPAEHLLQAEQQKHVAKDDAEQCVSDGRVAFWNHGANSIHKPGPPEGGHYGSGGVAVFRGGRKNGVGTTVAPTKWRVPSTVISIRSAVPVSKWGASIVASAIRRLSVGDHAVVVARPTWRPALITGTADRDAAAGATGGSS